MATSFLPQHPAKRFLLLFAVIYSIFLVLGVFAGGRTYYQKAFRSMGESIFGSYGEHGIVKFMDVEKSKENTYNPEFHTMILMGNQQQAQKAMREKKNVTVSKTYINDYFIGFLPTMTLLALLLATPMDIKRKLVVILIGLVAITLIVILRQWVLVVTDMTNNPALELVTSSKSKVKFLIGLKRVFVTNIVVTMMIPFLLWGMIAFRTQDLKAWFGEDIQRILKLK